MNNVELKGRTKRFAIDVIKMTETLPFNRSLDVLVKQILRSSSSVGANYRSACRGKSTADFLNKIIIVEEEADESLYWLELMEESGLVAAEKLSYLKKEADELTAIFTAIGKTTRTNLQKQANQKLKNNNINKESGNQDSENK